MKRTFSIGEIYGVIDSSSENKFGHDLRGGDTSVNHLYFITERPIVNVTKKQALRYCCMSLADNIKNIREEKNLKQIEVATHIGVDKSAYSKIEKGQRALTVDELPKMAQLFNLTS